MQDKSKKSKRPRAFQGRTPSFVELERSLRLNKTLPLREPLPYRQTWTSGKRTMKSLRRTLRGVLVGFFVALVFVVGVEAFSAKVYPPPEGFNAESMEEMCRYVAGYPQWILAVVVPVYAVTAFASTWKARQIGNATSAVIIGALLFAALAINVAKLPYPIWFKIACLLLIPAAILFGFWVGARTARPPRAAGP
jgi:hypothetical protein